MARAVEQIERDIAALQEAVSAIAAKLGNIYDSYLTALGQATRQQLILASYQLCTQGYPKEFLGLSFSQRQQLQQSICKLGHQAADQLLALFKTEEQEVSNQESEDSSSLLLGVETLLLPRSFLSEDPHHSKPMELLQWQQNIEVAIAATMKTLSLETNDLLQQTGILPQKLPTPLLEVAATASEAAADVMPGPPNLLNLLIETENLQEPEESNVTQVIAIQLRLAEIEFADAKVNAARHQIRNLEVRLKSLEREYDKRQRELTVAEAEAAWRASWYDN